MLKIKIIVTKKENLKMGNYVNTDYYKPTDYEGFDSNVESKHPSVKNKRWIIQSVPARFKLTEIKNIDNTQLREYYKEMYAISSKLPEIRHGEKAWWILRWSSFGLLNDDSIVIEEEDILARKRFLKQHATSGDMQWFFEHEYMVELATTHPDHYIINFDYTIPGNILIYHNHFKVGKHNQKEAKITVSKININRNTFATGQTLQHILPKQNIPIFNPLSEFK